MNELALIDELLASARTIAVVGYSTNPNRPSNSVSRYLREQGYRVIPVNPILRGSVVDGEQAYDRLADIPAEVGVDFVDVFRRGEFLDAVVDDALARGAACASSGIVAPRSSIVAVARRRQGSPAAAWREADLL